MKPTVRVEHFDHRRMRERNKVGYRLAHWPIWIWVFFLAPGPLVFNLFAHGGDKRNLVWLALVIMVTGWAGWKGQLPGVEPRPYILRFTEDKPNPLYRRICYTFAWNALLSFALLNLAGLIVAVVMGRWYMHQIYWRGYFPLSAIILLLGMLGLLPRVRASTQGEGTERRYFYGTVWAVTAAQIVLLTLWKALPKTPATDIAKLVAYVGVLAVMGVAAARGLLPRTRRIVPGEWAVSD